MSISGSSYTVTVCGTCGKPKSNPYIISPDECSCGIPTPADPQAPTGQGKDGISTNPKIQEGQPCIEGTRIPVHLVLRAIALYCELSGINTAYPDLTEQNAKDALWFGVEKTKLPDNADPQAADHVRCPHRSLSRIIDNP